MTTTTPLTLYVGTKTVRAAPMTRQAYNDYRGWKLPENENGDDAGFLVEYVDGGKPNDSRHAGYISWSPADVFARSYRPVGTFQDRVRAELSDIDEKCKKLDAFLSDVAAVALLGVDERSRLDHQLEAMTVYAGILRQRIVHFEPAHVVG